MSSRDTAVDIEPWRLSSREWAAEFEQLILDSRGCAVLSQERHVSWDSSWNGLRGGGGGDDRV